MNKQERIAKAKERLYELESKFPPELTEEEKAEMIELKQQYG